jgi:hypothetical protein
MRFILSTIIFGLLTSASFAQHANKESHYQEFLCNSLDGVMEYRLQDKTRVDCLTGDYAIEVDFQEKAYDCIGQALYYGIKTNRSPACALIVKEKQNSYVNRLNVVAEYYGIKVILIEE